jgi:hypothetical protein
MESHARCCAATPWSVCATWTYFVWIDGILAVAEIVK